MLFVNKKQSFINRLISFDFYENYSTKVRVLSHLLMWISLTSFYPVTYHFIYNYSWNDSLLLTLRLVLCNVAFFYLIFYITAPFLLNRGKIFFFILSIIASIQIWLIINHYFFSIIDFLNIKFDDIMFNELIKKNITTSFIDVAFSNKLFVQFIEIINFISPFFFIKITFDLTRIYSKKLKTTKELEHSKYENVMIENKFLQSQLNPHFLFNTLNNLYGLSIKKDDLTPQLILKLSEIMRYTLYETNVERIQLDKELDFIDNYFEMEKIRYPKDFTITKTIKSIHSINATIAPLISFVFIENAFKFGLKSSNPFLHLEIETDNNRFKMQLQNDFSNKVPENQLDKNNGIGIENVVKRLNLIYPNSYQLDIKVENNTYIVLLEIELLKNNGE